MRIPNIQHYDNKNKYSTMNINTPSPLQMNYNVMSHKDIIKLVKMVESIVRKSLEYKQFIHFLKTEIDMTQCSYFNNVSNKNKKVSIEIHHEPFTLFDITYTVVSKFINEEIELNPLTIAEEVLLIHYKNYVGLIPLSATVHDLVTDGKLFIPLQNVFGDYTEFIREYDAYISEDLKEQLKMKLIMSKDVANNDMSILETKYVYLEVDGFNLPQTIIKEK